MVVEPQNECRTSKQCCHCHGGVESCWQQCQLRLIVAADSALSAAIQVQTCHGGGRVPDNGVRLRGLLFCPNCSKTALQPYASATRWPVHACPVQAPDAAGAKLWHTAQCVCGCPINQHDCSRATDCNSLGPQAQHCNHCHSHTTHSTVGPTVWCVNKHINQHIYNQPSKHILAHHISPGNICSRSPSFHCCSIGARCHKSIQDHGGIVNPHGFLRTACSTLRFTAVSRGLQDRRLHRGALSPAHLQLPHAYMHRS